MRQDANNNPEILLKELREITDELESLNSSIEEKTNQPTNSNLPHKVILCLLSAYLNPSLEIFTMTSVFLFVEFKYRQDLINENKSTRNELSEKINEYTDQIQQMIDGICIDSRKKPMPDKYIKKRNGPVEQTASYKKRIGELINIINAASEHIKKILPVEPPRKEKVKTCCFSLRTRLAR